MSVENSDTLIAGAPPELISVLRELDHHISFLKARSQLMLQEHIASQGWSLETHNINFDLSAGMFTVTPIQQVEEPISPAVT